MLGQAIYRLPQQEDLNYVVFLQQFFNVGILNLTQQLPGHQLLQEAHIHLGERLTVPEHDGGVEQIPDVVGAPPHLGHAPVYVQQGVDRLHAGAHGIFGGEDGVPGDLGKLAQEGEVYRAVRHDLGAVGVVAGHEEGIDVGHHHGHRVGAALGQFLDALESLAG